MNKQIPWEELSKIAWAARENAYIYGKTKVGAAVYCENGKMYSGCNTEHIFRSHDIHAEVNAIGNMISAGEKEFLAILIVADRELFTPCGSCMDWIMQHGGDNCSVAFQNKTGLIKKYTSHELMPYYPH